MMVPLAAAITACSGTDTAGTTVTGGSTPTPHALYVDQYAGASSALDAATAAWRTALSRLASSGTDSTTTEAPFDTAYAHALNTFDYTLLSIRFPPAMQSDVNSLINAGTAVQADLLAFAAGHGSTSQLISDETTLQAAINVVQSDMGIPVNTP